MKTIADIRIFRSNVANVNGSSFPQEFGDKELACRVTRIVLKLREYKFSLGDYSHLYINFTSVDVPNGRALANRSVDKEFSWFRYYDCQIDREFLDKPLTDGERTMLLQIIEEVLVSNFSTSATDTEVIKNSFEEERTMGEEMTAVYKEKANAQNKAALLLRHRNDGMFYPLLKVWDRNGIQILENDLHQDNIFLLSLGEIRLKRDSVTITPKKNVFTKDLNSVTFFFDR